MRSIILLFIALSTLFFPTPSSAVDYHSLAPIDGYVQNINKIDDNTLGKYLDGMFKLGIALCTGLAVLMIIIGGIQYVSSDAWSKKTDGRERIFAALTGLLIALGSWVLLNTISPRLVSTELSLERVELSEIKTKYNKVYAQWTDADDAALEDPNNTAYPAALNKWNKMQSEKDALDAEYGPQVNPATAGVGAANQKILAEINKGTSCSTSDHCSDGAADLATKAGVAYGSTAYQSDKYRALGRSDYPSKGSARLPVPGEMVDYRFYLKNQDGTERDDPFHAVVIYSDEGNGTYKVWDWKHNVSGLRTVTLNLDQPGTKGYVGRIYVPQ